VTLGGGERRVAPGQACVFYADDAPMARVLGGGTIAHALAVSASNENRGIAPST